MIKQIMNDPFMGLLNTVIEPVKDFPQSEADIIPVCKFYNYDGVYKLVINTNVKNKDDINISIKNLQTLIDTKLYKKTNNEKSKLLSFGNFTPEINILSELGQGFVQILLQKKLLNTEFKLSFKCNDYIFMTIIQINEHDSKDNVSCSIKFKKYYLIGEECNCYAGKISVPQESILFN